MSQNKMIIEQDKLNNLFALQTKINKKIAAEKAGMPDFISGFSVSMNDFIDSLGMLWKWYKPNPSLNEEESLKKLAHCYMYGLLTFQCVPLEIKKADGTADHPFDNTVKQFLETYASFMDSIYNNDGGTVKDVIQLVETACELQDDQHLTFVSEFALVNIIAAMAFPTLTFEDIVKAYESEFSDLLK